MLFDDQYESTYDELNTYYPKYYTGVKEMQEVLKTEGDLIDGVKVSIEQVLGDGFIDTADEATIAKLEKFLHIHMRGARTLDERRRLVKSYFVGAGKVSAQLVSDIIGTYTGAASKCKFEPFDNSGNNMLYIDSERGPETTFYASDIIELIGAKLPAHIAFQFNVEYRFESIIKNEIVFGYPVNKSCGDMLAGQEVYMP